MSARSIRHLRLSLISLFFFITTDISVSLTTVSWKTFTKPKFDSVSFPILNSQGISQIYIFHEPSLFPSPYVPSKQCCPPAISAKLQTLSQRLQTVHLLGLPNELLVLSIQPWWVQIWTMRIHPVGVQRSRLALVGFMNLWIRRIEVRIVSFLGALGILICSLEVHRVQRLRLGSRWPTVAH